MFKLSWSLAWALWAAALALDLHSEVTRGHSVAGCYLRGLYGVDGGACDG